MLQGYAVARIRALAFAVAFVVSATSAARAVDAQVSAQPAIARLESVATVEMRSVRRHDDVVRRVGHHGDIWIAAQYSAAEGDWSTYVAGCTSEEEQLPRAYGFCDGAGVMFGTSICGGCTVRTPASISRQARWTNGVNATRSCPAPGAS